MLILKSSGAFRKVGTVHESPNVTPIPANPSMIDPPQSQADTANDSEAPNTSIQPPDPKYVFQIDLVLQRNPDHLLVTDITIRIDPDRWRRATESIRPD